jgi:arabinogalactan oligomer/maltooligosaccharide transport system substrate-binding protein
MYYDTTVVTDPTSLEQILKDCEAAGKNFYFDVGNGWYQPAFFFGVGCTLTYDSNNEGKLTKCNIDYDSDLGLVAMREMIDLVASPAFVPGASVGDAINPGVVISGTWDKESAVAKFVDADGNSVLGAAKLPKFEGSDGKSYQMGGFSGYKLMGVKKQTEQGKAIVCMELAEYLTSTDVQLARFEEVGWGPSNLKALENPDIQNDPALVALGEQSLYTIPQGQYPSEYWSEAGNLAAEITSKNITVDSTDDEIRALLKSFQEKCIGYATAE